MDKLKCLQINLNRSKAASQELSNKSHEVVCMTEPMTSKRADGSWKTTLASNCSKWQVLSSEGNLRPRAALRVSRHLHPWLVSCFTDEDVCIAAVKINGILVYLCSLYLDIVLESVQNKKFLETVRWCERDPDLPD